MIGINTSQPDHPGLSRSTGASCALLLCILLLASPARAQTPAPQPANSGVDNQVTITSDRYDDQADEGHRVDCGNVAYDLGEGAKFFADCIDYYYKGEKRIVARGNVVFTNTEGRIAAERVEFDLDSGLGTFYQANGLMSLGPRADRRQFGNQEPDVFFWGETIEKIGPRKYNITTGGFTTCVQPTARWELRTGNLRLNLNDYAIARNTVLRVKGVPLMYMPLVYYPIQDDDRATGFLLPTYGTSNVRGQAISNAFFWAIGRSHDATFFHDWFTKSGQGFGTEYRYVAAADSSGTLRYYLLDEKARQITVNDTVSRLEAQRSFEITGNLVHALTPKWRARARLDYVSSFLTQQLYHQDVNRAVNPIRTMDANLSGTAGAFSISAGSQWTEVFGSVTPGNTRSQQYGGLPRVTVNAAPRQIFGTPIYAGLNSEYGYFPNREIQNGTVTRDNSLHRLDFSPTARIPLSKLTFLTVNSSAAFRTTYYSRSFDDTGVAIDEPLRRQFLTLQSNVIGPVLTKIWDTPGSTRTQRMKHVIEPTLGVTYYTDIANYRATPTLVTDQSDKIVGGMTQLTYGLNNRLFYRSRVTDSGRGSTREFVTVGVQQTYYTKPEASSTDAQYTSRSNEPTAFSPISLSARFSPSTLIDATSRVEYDTSGGGMRLLSVGSSVSAGGSTSNVTFSRTRFGNGEPSNYMQGSTGLVFAQNRLRTNYAVNWNIALGYIVSQRATLSYLAQCCGLEVDVQQFNYPESSGIPFASDRRINFSFILAGLGTFSNFFGAFGGQR